MIEVRAKDVKETRQHWGWKNIRSVSRHFSKGLLELLSDGLVLLLLRDQLILQPVHLEHLNH